MLYFDDMFRFHLPVKPKNKKHLKCCLVKWYNFREVEMGHWKRSPGITGEKSPGIPGEKKIEREKSEEQLRSIPRKEREILPQTLHTFRGCDK